MSAKNRSEIAIRAHNARKRGEPGTGVNGMKVRIYQPAKTAMQSGWANARKWRLEHEPQEAARADRLMGWIGSGDTRGQLRMSFDTREEAIAFAEKKGYEYTVDEPRPRRVKPKSYADNFRWDRVEP